jgi:hypothetical protein
MAIIYRGERQGDRAAHSGAATVSASSRRRIISRARDTPGESAVDSICEAGFDRGMRGWLVMVLFAGALAGCGGGAAAAKDAARDSSAASETAPGETSEAGVAEIGATDGTMDVANDADDARSDATPGDGEPSGDVARDGDAALDATSDAACVAGCAPEKHANFCQTGEVQWLCGGPALAGGDRVFSGACRMAPTDAIRYCCPPSFLAMCQ